MYCNTFLKAVVVLVAQYYFYLVAVSIVQYFKTVVFQPLIAMQCPKRNYTVYITLANGRKVVWAYLNEFLVDVRFKMHFFFLSLKGTNYRNF